MVTWHDAITGALLGEFPEEWNRLREFPNRLCPICGNECEYQEGTIDQDRQGNDIQGCWWMCLVCGCTSESQETDSER